MEVVSSVLNELRRRMALAMPERIIGSNYVTHQERRRDELLAGVITVVLPEIEMSGDWSSAIKPMVVAQLEVDERSSTPKDIEAAELKMAGQLRAFFRNPGADMPHIDVRAIRLSAQQEFPMGWVAVDVVLGPIGETALAFDLNGQAAGSEPIDLYPTPVNVSPLAGVMLNIDVSPHETVVEHTHWLADNYVTSHPDLKQELEFNNGTN